MFFYCLKYLQIQFSKSIAVDHIFGKWHLESNDLHYGSFSCKELILAHQISLFQTGGIRANRKINEFYKVNFKLYFRIYRFYKISGQILVRRLTYKTYKNNFKIFPKN